MPLAWEPPSWIRQYIEGHINVQHVIISPATTQTLTPNRKLICRLYKWQSLNVEALGPTLLLMYLFIWNSEV